MTISWNPNKTIDQITASLRRFGLKTGDVTEKCLLSPETVMNMIKAKGHDPEKIKKLIVNEDMSFLD